jgi:uncharacterized membrane protein YphA (DoxX/SURF4 family)
MTGKLGGLRGGTVIIGATVTATGLTMLNKLLQGNVTVKPIISGFIVGTMLLIVGFWTVPVAAALALLLLVTSVLVNGEGILEEVS